MKEAYVSYEIAKLLKEKGFNEPCIRHWDCDDHSLYGANDIPISNSELRDNEYNGVSAPTHQMAMAWLREKGIIIDILAQNNKTTSPKYMFNIWDYNATQWNKHICEYQPAFVEQELEFTTYEEAVEAALKYSLENLL